MKKVCDVTSKLNAVEHKCALCPYSTQILRVYKNHLRVHSIEKPFKCPECPFRTKWKSVISRHVKTAHLFGLTSTNSRPFPCPRPGCSYAATDKSRLTQHSKVHLDEKSFSCSFQNCNYSTNNKSDFIAHVRTHTGEKPYICQFESCSYAAVTLGHLQRHTRTHTKEKPYKCPEPNCEFSASQQSTIAKHQLTHEPKDGKEHPSFKCPICEYSTNSKGKLSAHINTHTLEKLFRCDEPNCSFKSKTKTHVERHKVMHSDEKPFVCSFELCDYRCKWKQALHYHLKSHSEERRYKCELCPFRGKTRNVVKNHINNVHSDPDFRPFKCPEPKCNSAFKRKDHLQSHLLAHQADKKYCCSFPLCEYRAVLAQMVRAHELRVHETEKRFKCQLCSFATRDKSTLVGHVRTHTKETPYKCKEEGCEYRANQSSALRQHQKRNHPQMFNQTK